MKIIIVAIFLSLFSCTRVDPHPESNDEIYRDLGVELEIATKNLEIAEKTLDSAMEDYKKAVPQTGQIKFATQKLRSTEAYLAETKQRKIFFDIKRERRKNYVEFRYEESLHPGGRPWPDPKEVEEYRAIAKFNREKFEWDKTKGTKKNVPRGTKPNPTGDGEAEEHP